jgi:hypothetical protein
VLVPMLFLVFGAQAQDTEVSELVV